MPKYCQNAEEELREEMQQEWRGSGYNTVIDQYGFVIALQKPRYEIRWKGKKVGETFSLPAAKIIANVILNDYIQFKP